MHGSHQCVRPPYQPCYFLLILTLPVAWHAPVLVECPSVAAGNVPAAHCTTCQPHGVGVVCMSRTRRSCPACMWWVLNCAGMRVCLQQHFVVPA